MELKTILEYSGGVLAILLTLIQITPIKINPWSAIAKAIGRAINGDVLESLKAAERRIDENEIDRLRWEILDFANSCRNGRKHTQEEFEHILDMHEKYEKILIRQHRENGKVTRAYEYIKDIYDKRNENNDFLPQ